jgi:hypothetical protein
MPKPNKHYYRNLSHRAKVELSRSVRRLAALFEAKWRKAQ